jgi:hypothetical protein
MVNPEELFRHYEQWIPSTTGAIPIAISLKIYRKY